MRNFLTLAALAALAACEQQTSDPALNEAESQEITAVDRPGNGDQAARGDNALAPTDDVGDPDMRWNFSRDARGPKLAYGEPATDNVRLMLRCVGSGRIELSFMRPGPAASAGDTMTISSGGSERQLQARVEQTQLGPVMVRAAAPIAADPLRNFRNGNALHVDWRQERISVPAAGEEAEQLFGACDS